MTQLCQLFVIACSYEELAPLAPPLIPPLFSDQPWQGMLGPTGQAAMPLVTVNSRRKTTPSVMGNVRQGVGASPPTSGGGVEKQQ